MSGGEGILAVHTARQVWGGVEVRAIDYHSVPDRRSCLELTAPRHRIGVMLQQVGGYCEARTAPGLRGVTVNPGARFLNLIPGGMPVWGYSDQIRYGQELAVLFTPDILAERLHRPLRPDEMAPRRWLTSQRVFILAELLASELASGGEFGPLYGEGLTLALLVEYLRLIGRHEEPARRTGGLTAHQLRSVRAYIEAHLAEPVALRELAALTGLSLAHFSRAFKTSTGVPPYRWLLSIRIDRAQQALLASDATTADIAAQTGFVDQSHLTRVFRRLVGATPRAWRRAHGGRGVDDLG